MKRLKYKEYQDHRDCLVGEIGRFEFAVTPWCWEISFRNSHGHLNELERGNCKGILRGKKKISEWIKDNLADIK